MHTATSLNRLDRWQVAGESARTEPDTRPVQLVQYARENVRLAQENELLRQSYADLTTAAETWIRLYESALARANAAEKGMSDIGAGKRSSL
jgi:hypothetical protein